MFLNSLTDDFWKIINFFSAINVAEEEVEKNKKIIKIFLEESILRQKKNVSLAEEFSSVMGEGTEGPLFSVWTAVNLYLNIFKSDPDFSGYQNLVELHESVISSTKNLISRIG